MREIAAISSDLVGIEARFLCVPDCVAEREGFEPSVQVFVRTTGLASESISPPLLVFKYLQSDSIPLGRAKSFGNYCAAFCAPQKGSP
jgi:hypothetical protein